MITFGSDVAEAAVPAREFGKPGDGRKRRTKVEIAEDEEVVARGQIAALDKVAVAEANRHGRSANSSRPVAPPAPAEEPDITDFDMYGAASKGAAVLGADAVKGVFADFKVADAAAIKQEDRQAFLDEIDNMIASNEG